EHLWHANPDHVHEHDRHWVNYKACRAPWFVGGTPAPDGNPTRHSRSSFGSVRKGMPLLQVRTPSSPNDGPRVGVVGFRAERPRFSGNRSLYARLDRPFSAPGAAHPFSSTHRTARWSTPVAVSKPSFSLIRAR